MSKSADQGDILFLVLVPYLGVAGVVTFFAATVLPWPRAIGAGLSWPGWFMQMMGEYIARNVIP